MLLGDPRGVTNLPVLQVHSSIEEAGSFQGEKKAREKGPEHRGDTSLQGSERNPEI